MIIINLLAVGIATLFIDGFFTGFLFHRFQKATPQTWRTESGKSYALSSLLYLVYATAFTHLYAWLHGQGALVSFHDALLFGAITWLTFPLIFYTSSTIYVNWNKSFVVGKLISSLLSVLTASIISYFIL